MVWILEGAWSLCAGPSGSAVRALASEYPSIPAETRQPFDSSDAVQVVTQVVDHARTTGELGPGVIAPHVLNVGFDVLTTRYLLSSEAPGSAAVRAIVADIWLPALRAAAPPHPA